MNRHLEPAFEILDTLMINKIDYWVFGGLGIAAFAERFIRTNKDIDIFLKDIDFNKTVELLTKVCQDNDYLLKYYKKTFKNPRPKVEILIEGKELLSMIPVFNIEGKIIFKYLDGDQEYSKNILIKISRKIDNYKFITPQNEYIKQLFVNHLKARPDKVKRSSFQIDGKAIFTNQEYKKLFDSVLAKSMKGELDN